VFDSETWWQSAEASFCGPRQVPLQSTGRENFINPEGVLQELVRNSLRFNVPWFTFFCQGIRFTLPMLWSGTAAEVRLIIVVLKEMPSGKATLIYSAFLLKNFNGTSFSGRCWPGISFDATYESNCFDWEWNPLRSCYWTIPFEFNCSGHRFTSDHENK
jgi:hypothetical protein